MNPDDLCYHYGMCYCLDGWIFWLKETQLLFMSVVRVQQVREIPCVCIRSTLPPPLLWCFSLWSVWAGSTSKDCHYKQKFYLRSFSSCKFCPKAGIFLDTYSEFLPCSLSSHFSGQRLSRLSSEIDTWSESYLVEHYLYPIKLKERGIWWLEVICRMIMCHDLQIVIPVFYYPLNRVFRIVPVLWN